MSISVFGIVLFAAALHATWNAIVKSAGDTLQTTVLVAGASSLLAIGLLPWLTPPNGASWPFIGASAVLQVIYYVQLAHTYRVADMSYAYSARSLVDSP